MSQYYYSLPVASLDRLYKVSDTAFDAVLQCWWRDLSSCRVAVVTLCSNKTWPRSSYCRITTNRNALVRPALCECTAVRGSGPACAGQRALWDVNANSVSRHQTHFLHGRSLTQRLESARRTLLVSGQMARNIDVAYIGYTRS